MKKRTLLLIVVFLLSFALSAEDALLPPAGTLQSCITGAFSFASSRWDENWRREDLAIFRYYAVNTGATVEFGVVDWLAAALQWTPGFNIWSSFYQAPVPYDKATAIGPYDLYAAVKVQILGDDALISSEIFRLTVAPFVKFPLFGRFFEHEYDRAVSGKIWRFEDTDLKVLGVGGRCQFDYVLNRKHYLNLLAEFLFFPGPLEGSELSWSWETYGFTGAVSGDALVDFGFRITAEVEPHLELLSTDGLHMEVGLPLRYAMTPEVKFDGTAIAESDTHYLIIAPNLTLQFVKPTIPLELKASYSLPLFGKNVDAGNTITVSVQNRFRIYGK